MVAILIPSLWALWLAYWLVSARGTKASVRRENRWSRRGRLSLMLAAGLLLWLPPSPSPIHAVLATRFLPDSRAVAWAGCATVALGLGFAVWARLHLGRNWSGTVTIKQDHELIRSGPYALARHPIYTGLLTAFAGSAIAAGHLGALLATLLISVVLWSKIRLEERWLCEAFGEQYPRYRREVKALIPFIL